MRFCWTWYIFGDATVLLSFYIWCIGVDRYCIHTHLLWPFLIIRIVFTLQSISENLIVRKSAIICGYLLIPCVPKVPSKKFLTICSLFYFTMSTFFMNDRWMHRVSLYRDNVYKYCSKASSSREIQETNLFPISRKTSSNPSTIEFVIHLRRNCFRITRLSLHLCNNWSSLPELFV